MGTEDQQIRQVRPAFDTLREIRDGACLEDLAQAINVLTERVSQTRKGGSVTLTIGISPAAQSTVAMVIDDDIKTKLPALPKPSTIMFMTEEFNVQREHPKQSKLDLKIADQPAREAASEK